MSLPEMNLVMLPLSIQQSPQILSNSPFLQAEKWCAIHLSQCRYPQRPYLHVNQLTDGEIQIYLMHNFLDTHASEDAHVVAPNCGILSKNCYLWKKIPPFYHRWFFCVSNSTDFTSWHSQNAHKLNKINVIGQMLTRAWPRVKWNQTETSLPIWL